MNYFEEIEKINVEILDLRRQASYIIRDEKIMALISENYFKENCDHYGVPISNEIGYSIRMAIKDDVLEIKNKIVDLKKKRDAICTKIVDASKLSTFDCIAILEKFGMFYKIERLGVKTLIVPQDLNITKFGTKSIMPESELLKKLEKQQSVKEKDGKIIQSDVEHWVPLYINSTVYGTHLNNHIPELTAGIEISDIEGIQVYKTTADGVEFNSKLLNIFPYDVLAFLDSFIMQKIENPELNVLAAFDAYAKDCNSALGLSYDDPTMKDTYRHR